MQIELIKHFSSHRAGDKINGTPKLAYTSNFPFDLDVT